MTAQKTERYQGWANWATWNVVLWVGNDEPIYRAMQLHKSRLPAKAFSAHQAEEFVRTRMPRGTPDMREEKKGKGTDARFSVYRDVNWIEVARSFNEE